MPADGGRATTKGNDSGDPTLVTVGEGRSGPPLPDLLLSAKRIVHRAAGNVRPA